MDSVERLKVIKEQIEKVQKKSLLAAKHVNLIAVSKTQNQEAIEPLIKAGQLVYGENRVQEAAEKWPAIFEAYPQVKLHLIGTLQSNKVKQALSLFDAIHTIDRSSLVDALANELKKPNPVRCKEFFVQVNTGEEPQKGGVVPSEFAVLMDHIKAASLPISGLMCVPPTNDNPAPHFALLYKLAKESGLDHLSMGMSGDFETAVQLGATHVRIGTALFGERLH